MVGEPEINKEGSEGDALRLAKYRSTPRSWAQKTFKRELAYLALAFWAIVSIRIFWFLPVDFIRALDSAYGMLSSTIWLYTAAAFGMDAFSKQIQDPTRRYRVDYSMQETYQSRDGDVRRARVAGSTSSPTPDGRDTLPVGVDPATIPPAKYGVN